MIFLGTYFTYLALFLLSLALDKHYKEFISKDINKKLKYLFMGLGYLILVLSLFIYIQIFGASLGTTYWLGIVGIIISLIAMVYTFYPKYTIKLSILLLVITLLFTLI